MKYGGNLKNSQEEKGTGKDVKAADGRKTEMRHGNHEFGPERNGKDCHEHHRGKS